MRRTAAILLIALTLLMVGITFLALIESNRWWIRMTDFPRLQYLIALTVLIGVLAMSRFAGGWLRLGLGALAMAALAFNVARLVPYVSGTPELTEACSADRTVSVMIANVKLENRHAEALLDIVAARNPDVLLALETNEWWDEQLSALSGEMPHSVAQITGGYFGMHLFSSLPLSETETIFPVDQDAPAILATAHLPSGDDVRLIGLHPRPPHPGQSSTGRDAQLMWAALRARKAESPAVVAGDMNAVPWERGVERLQRIGRLIDPRTLHGFLPTYDAHSWWMAWPLDQLLHQPGLSVVSMEVLSGFGSDHYPVEVTLCHRPAQMTPPEPRPGDLAEARADIAAALAGAGEDR